MFANTELTTAISDIPADTNATASVRTPTVGPLLSVREILTLSTATAASDGGGNANTLEHIDFAYVSTVGYDYGDLLEAYSTLLTASPIGPRHIVPADPPCTWGLRWMRKSTAYRRRGLTATTLSAATVRVTDLPERHLGLASPVTNTVWLDADAAGYGRAVGTGQWSAVNGEGAGSKEPPRDAAGSTCGMCWPMNSDTCWGWTTWTRTN